MNIALINEHRYDIGGNFQYALSMMRMFASHASAPYRCHFFTTNLDNIPVIRSAGIEEIILLNLHKGIIRRGRNAFENYRIRLGLYPHTSLLDELLEPYNIDLIWFLNHSFLAQKTVKHNFVHPVFDLCHRDHPEFPEVRDNRIFEDRERLFRHVLPKSVAIIVDSPHSHDNVVRCYGVDPARVHVIPYLPSVDVMDAAARYVPTDSAVDVRGKYRIPGDFIFYPAQLWAHKNHCTIIGALQELKMRRGQPIHAVFSGTDRGNRRYVEQLAEDAGVANQIHFLGHVPGEELPELYRQALALVMPTYFGPTNIPPIEAFLLRTPVLYPDLPGLRDQVDGAAFLFDPDSPVSLADAIVELTHADAGEMRRRLDTGYAIAARIDEASCWQSVRKILDAYRAKRRCWP